LPSGDLDFGIAVDQLRAVDKSRLIRRIATITGVDARRISDTLVEFFAW